MKNARVYNFSAGPANLPVPVLEQVRDELLNFQGSGMSVMEMSHRSKYFDEIQARAISLLRELYQIPENYDVLFLQGGASLQFSMVPMNLYTAGKPVDFLHTGYWSEMALKEMKKLKVESRMVYSGEATKFTSCPSTVPSDSFHSDASYAYLCSNNTIEGSQWKTFPKTGNIPLVADFSSDFLSRPIKIQDFGLIFAGAQKNLGPAGATAVIIRKDLAERGSETLPTMLQYRTHVKGDSRYNTPPSFTIYVCGLVMEWIKKLGGLEAIQIQNEKKASALYSAIDQSGGFYQCPIQADSRSPMNVVWRIKPGSPEGEKLEEQFITEAKKEGMIELKGHRSVGGLRASIYNAHPLEGALALSQFLRDFQKRNG